MEILKIEPEVPVETFMTTEGPTPIVEVELKDMPVPAKRLPLPTGEL